MKRFWLACHNSVLNVKALVGAFNQEKALRGLLRDCENFVVYWCVVSWCPPSEQFSQICSPRPQGPRQRHESRQMAALAGPGTILAPTPARGSKLQFRSNLKFPTWIKAVTGGWAGAELVDTRWSQNVRQLSSLHPALSVTSPPRPAPRLAAATYNLLCQYFGGNLGWRPESTQYRADSAALDSTGAGLSWPVVAVRECGEERQCCNLNLHKPVGLVWCRQTSWIKGYFYPTLPRHYLWVQMVVVSPVAVFTADFTPHMFLFCGARFTPRRKVVHLKQIEF